MHINLQQLKKEQTELSKKLVLFDSFDKAKLNTVAACDIIYVNNEIIAVFAVFKIENLEIIEKRYSRKRISFPYIPDFLSYRELPAIVDAYSKLIIKPDIIIIKRKGILHPRKMGVASHIGLLLDMPTIGISKDFLPGTLDSKIVYLEKEAAAKMIETKEKAKPIFISPGHKISLTTATEIIKQMLKGHKLPEPLHITHKLAVKLKHKAKELNSIYHESQNIAEKV